jgi:hypothetical protein
VFRWITYDDPIVASPMLNYVLPKLVAQMRRITLETGKRMTNSQISKILGVKISKKDGKEVIKIVGGKGTFADAYMNLKVADAQAWAMPDRL